MLTHAHLNRSQSRRARPAIDAVRDARYSPTRGTPESSAALGPHGSHSTLRAAWEQLASEIDRANRPRGRATPAIRELVRRIARSMRADGASREEIHDALVRAVSRQQRALDDVPRPPDVIVSESLLADVLSCAAAEGR